MRVLLIVLWCSCFPAANVLCCPMLSFIMFQSIHFFVVFLHVEFVCPDVIYGDVTGTFGWFRTFTLFSQQLFGFAWN